MYDELANLIEANKVLIANLIADEAFDKKIATYTSRPKAELLPLLVNNVETIVRYIRTGDPTEYRSIARKLTLDRLAKGFNVDDVYIMSGVVLAKMIQVVEEQMTQPELKREKERFLRRLQGVQTLAQNTIVAAQFDYSKQEKKL